LNELVWVDGVTKESPIESNTVLILGASVRAAAFSALRAGMIPVCADLFSDLDLTRHASVIRVPGAEYPHGLRRAANLAPMSPWLYVGGLENHPKLVADIAATRPLWGIGPEVLRRVRDPFRVYTCLTRAGLPCPQVRRLDDAPPDTSDWLVKPFDGAGGRGTRDYSLSTQYSDPVAGSPTPCSHYLQQRIDGPSYSATFVADGKGACLLGLTRQLVGERDLHAKPFHYCGSIGPLPIDQKTHADLSRLGQVLAAEFGLLGLFGVDEILAGGEFWPVEINPRYTASVEVLELGLGVPTMTVHRDACTRRTIAPDAVAIGRRVSTEKGIILGKAILFAAESIVVPDLSALLRNPLDCTGRWPVPRIADVPRAGEQFVAGQPICTLFAVEDSVDACRRSLFDAARRLYGQLTSATASSTIAAWLS